MIFHANTDPEQVIDFFRDLCIRQNAAPMVIDALDRVYGNITRESEIEKLGDEISELEKTRDDLYEELEQLTDMAREALAALECSHLKDDSEAFTIDELKAWQRKLVFAEKALERHK